MCVFLRGYVLSFLDLIAPRNCFSSQGGPLLGGLQGILRGGFLDRLPHELHSLGFPMHLELHMLPLRIEVSPDRDVWGRYYSARYPGSWLTHSYSCSPRNSKQCRSDPHPGVYTVILFGWFGKTSSMACFVTFQFRRSRPAPRRGMWISNTVFSTA